MLIVSGSPCGVSMGVLGVFLPAVLVDQSLACKSSFEKSRVSLSCAGAASAASTMAMLGARLGLVF